jgi:hypothetical protein
MGFSIITNQLLGIPPFMERLVYPVNLVTKPRETLRQERGRRQQLFAEAKERMYVVYC